MRVTDSYAVDERSTIFTVEISNGLYVDVKLFKDTGLCYIMQNGDGSTIYGETGTEIIRIGTRYDEQAVLDMVRKCNFEGGNLK